MALETEPSPVSFTRREVSAILWGLLLAMFLASIDQTIVATALSTIARDLDGWETMAWVVSAYLVTTTVTTPEIYALGTATTGVSFAVIAMALFSIAILRARQSRHGSDAGHA